MSLSSTSVLWQSPILPSTSQTSSPKMLTPVTKPPTSAPKPSLDKERKPKLRASCDACAASKVKCDKQHPICGRCSANRSQCIYGISRKHGKPGRTRKRNRDGTPFIKGSKRHAPDGGDFRKFRIQPEPPVLRPLREFSETSSNWSSHWSSTPGTPNFEYEMTPEPFYMDATDLAFMDDMPLSNAQLTPELIQSIEPEPSFRDPFIKQQPTQPNTPDISTLGHYVGGDAVNPMDYTLHNSNLSPYSINSVSPSPQSPRSNGTNTWHSTHVNNSPSSSHCCYTLAYSTLYSLHTIGSDTIDAYPGMECKDIDSILSTTRHAIQSVIQLLSCPCASDPHLAMLYSSITIKVLSWYRIAAGVNVPESPGASPSLSGSCIPSSCPRLSSPLSATTSKHGMPLNPAFQAIQFEMYQFDEAEQQELKRQRVLRGLEHCRQLIDALANWDGEGASEQGRFLYDVLGAWLKNELFKTVRVVESG
ncbi:hypothetical protein GQ44DRAFT_702104 [Phaeosphaeriaceae sp. PMI808]|nr:hypothetical protein GQ44DRAFT_702104 [Phaeosphaeriaceae sp. PMI808]